MDFFIELRDIFDEVEIYIYYSKNDIYKKEIIKNSFFVKLRKLGINHTFYDLEAQNFKIEIKGFKTK